MKLGIGLAPEGGRMRKRKVTVAGLELVLAIFMSSCAAKHPIQSSKANQSSTANKVDSDASDVLMATDNIIKTTGQDLLAGKFPPGMDTNVKDALNSLIRAYIEADRVYIVYRDATIAGTVTPSQRAAVTSELNNSIESNKYFKRSKGTKMSTQFLRMCSITGG
jgi:hypothetical protein